MPRPEFIEHVCRLCMSSEYLVDLFITDGETSLNLKAVSCTNIEMFLGDGLPDTICVACKSTIQKFYTFRQRCFEVNMKLKSLLKCHQNGLYENVTMENTAKSGTNLNMIPKIFEFEETKITDDSAISQAKLTDKNSELLNCEHCAKVFTVKSALEKHLLSHSTSTRRFPCKLCPKSFSRSESNEIHMRSHLGIKPFICEICGSSSTKKQDLIRHMKIHSEERHFSCPTCGRTFKRSSDLPSHIRTHTGIRPYHCVTCSKSYTSHSGLRKHLKTCGNMDLNTGTRKVFEIN